MRSPAASRGRWVPRANVCAPWSSAWISYAARSSACPSSAVRYITYLLLLERTPPVSAPATSRARTLRKGIASLQIGIAAVGQAYNGRPVSPRCRLLGLRLGSVGLGLHLETPSIRRGGCLITMSRLSVRRSAPLIFCTLYHKLIHMHPGDQKQIGGVSENSCSTTLVNKGKKKGRGFCAA